MTSTTVDALKNLYVALGGTASDVTNLNVIPDVINAIAGLSSVKASSALSKDVNNNITITSSNNIYLNAPDGSIATSCTGELSLEGDVIYANGKVVLTEN